MIPKDKLVLVIIGSILFIPLYIAESETLVELRKKVEERSIEIKRLEEEISKYQDSLEQQKGVSKTLNEEIKRIGTQINKLNADIKLNEYQIQNTELAIADLSIAVKEKENNIEDDANSLAELMRVLYETDDQTLMEILLVRGTISEFLTSVKAYETLSDGMKDKLISLRDHKRVLQEEKEKRQNEEQTLNKYKADLTGKKSAQESVNNKKKNLLNESKNKESVYQRLVREREEKQSLIQKELQEIEDRLSLLINPSLLPPKRHGFLDWPVEKPYITQHFGHTDFSKTQAIYKGKGHNGTDFRGSIGTPILAAYDGIIKDFGNTDPLCPGGSYGKWLLLDHGNNLLTLYGHLSVNNVVARGQSVQKGERIAYSGDTGYVTGPHLHFMLYAANTFRLHKSNYCGMIPAGGYLNPEDYLPEYSG